MGYRDTQEQLEVRWSALQEELERTHQELAVASSRVEALRRAEWGTLGAWWFWFTLRRALRDLDTGPRWDGKSRRGLALAIRRQERTIAQGQAVIRWLEDTIAPTPPIDNQEMQSQPEQVRIVGAAVGGLVRTVLAVIGASARLAWSMVLLVIGVLVQDDTMDPPWFEVDGESPLENLETFDACRDSDVLAGTWTLAVAGSLLVAGSALWWWFGLSP